MTGLQQMELDLERVAKLETRVEVILKDVDEMRSDVKELHSRITSGNREIVEKMDTMQSRLEHRMDAQALSAKQQHEKIQKEIQKDIEKIEDRVSSLEKWKWYVIGGAAAVGFLLSHLMDLMSLLPK